jgi:hypothetical protein
MPKDDLVDLIFSLFEKSTYYDFNSLVKATNQPQLYLKEILNDLCMYPFVTRVFDHHTDIINVDHIKANFVSRSSMVAKKKPNYLHQYNNC